MTANSQRHCLQDFRYMDDRILLLQTERQLGAEDTAMDRKPQAVPTDKASVKTFIGRAARSVDFLRFRLDSLAAQGVLTVDRTRVSLCDEAPRLFQQAVPAEDVEMRVRQGFGTVEVVAARARRTAACVTDIAVTQICGDA